MKKWNFSVAALGGLLLAGCAGQHHYTGNTSNLDLPTPATVPTATATASLTTPTVRTSTTPRIVSLPTTTLSGPSTSVTGSAVAADQAATASSSISLPNAATSLPQPATPSQGGAAAPAAAVLSTTSYTVLEGDSLWKIAHKCKTTVNTLKALNGLSNNLIHPGQVLKVPAS